MNRDKLIKLLDLTSSPNDKEALAAIHRVNKYLKDSNMRWEQFLDSYIASEQKNTKIFKDEYVITEMNRRKEIAYSQELEERNTGLKNIIKILLFIIFVLIFVLAL